MRKLMKVAAGALLLAGLSGQAALASNGFELTNNDGDNNLAELTATGDNNVLSIVQSYDGLGAGNSLSISLDGDLNGSPLGSAFGGLTSQLGLTPGRIEQTGHGNAIALAVTGSSNLFALSQIGSGNTVSAMIVGNYNQAAVMQTGAGNSLSFAQHGNGNMLSVVQQSR